VEFFSFDAEYLRRLRAADPMIEDHFTGYFSELLKIKLRGRRATRSDALEITQETFYRVWKAVRSGNGIQSPERLGSFVNSVCNNILHEWYRINARTEALPDDYDEPTPINVENILVSQEDSARVRETLDSLDPKDASLLRAFFIQERPKEEICAEWKVSRNYLRVLLYRARERFRRAYLKKIDEHKDDPNEPR
jgi:RNA polymerase sigma-70 factor (ECF subfamily)